jgi:hypothetical protein
LEVRERVRLSSARGHAHRRAHAIEEAGAVEGLGNVTVRAHRLRTRGIEGLEVAGEEQHGNVRSRRIALQFLAHLVAVLARHHAVSEHQIGAQLSRFGDSVETVVDGRQREVFRREEHSDDLANRE